MRTIAERLQKAREAAGYNKAADAIEAFGFSQFTYYQHENGTREPGKPLLERYAKAYKVAIDWLWHGTGEMKGATSDPETAEIVRLIGYLDAARRKQVEDFIRFQATQTKKPQEK